jgi:acyl-CoA synthetase (AMP-forming)/AMP-acid ligase II
MRADVDAWDDSLRPRLRLDEVLAAAARESPHREAVVDDSGRLTYAELDAQVDELAAALREAGVQRGERVATAIATGIPGVRMLYAIARVEAVAVPINEFWAAREVADLLVHSEARHLITDTGLGSTGSPAAAAYDRLAPAARPRWTVLGAGGELRVRAAGTASGDLRDEARVAMLLFTSGSTARPKGALISHHGLVGTSHYVRVALGLTEEDRFLHLMPLYHVGGLSDGVLPVHLAGGTCVMMRFDAERALDVFERERITTTSAFSSMLDALQRAPGYRPERHAHWRSTTLSGGEQTYDRLRAAGVHRLVAGIGMTEMSGDIALTRTSQSAEEARRTLGMVLPGLDVRIVDPVTGRQCGPMDVGEIRVKGWSLFCGYIDGTTNLDDDGYFRTGDLGHRLPSGALCFDGRLKHVIKSGGENVSAHEVEAFLVHEVADVEAAVVVGVPDPVWEEKVVAFVELRAGAVVTPGELRERCRGRLAGYKIPKDFIVVGSGEWPLMAAGKIDRPRLSAMARDRLEAAAS